jgi:malonate decarboxylase beta subunit
MSGTQRAESVLDPDTFVPLLDTTIRGSLVVGSGLVGGAPVLIALTDGHVRGGTIGVREASTFAQLAEHAASGKVRGRRPVALIIGFDTGGVRVEEGPRALAAAAAVGVGLARLTLLGVRLLAVISGPRGCFGAPAVMAALPDHIIMTADARWGLTGPKLLEELRDGPMAEREAQRATSAAEKLSHEDVHAVVPDSADAIRTQVLDFVGAATRHRAVRSMEDRIADSAAVSARLQARLHAGRARTARAQGRAKPRRRDLLRYSFRGQWQPSGAIVRSGLIDAALGTLGERPALGLIVGPEQGPGTGVGIEEAAVVTDMIRRATGADGPARAVILTFLFCQGHALDLRQERFGLPRALAECLRAMVAARLRGHPIVSVLGGGTYGAAYLALAAPSHRILAMRGTSVAPMAPEVLRAFRALRGRAAAPETAAPLAELVPHIRIVDSVIRLPRVLREELTQLLATVRPETSV